MGARVYRALTADWQHVPLLPRGYRVASIASHDICKKWFHYLTNVTLN